MRPALLFSILFFCTHVSFGQTDSLFRDGQWWYCYQAHDEPERHFLPKLSSVNADPLTFNARPTVTTGPRFMDSTIQISGPLSSDSKRKSVLYGTKSGTGPDQVRYDSIWREPNGTTYITQHRTLINIGCGQKVSGFVNYMSLDICDHRSKTLWVTSEFFHTLYGWIDVSPKDALLFKSGSRFEIDDCGIYLGKTKIKILRISIGAHLQETVPMQIMNGIYGAMDSVKTGASNY